MGDGAETGAPRYKAFISYSHKDAAPGRWLHRRLEGYRLPRRMAGSEGDLGPVPARLTPIFRDREELPAAGDLSEKVRAALSESGSLIVVCSPSAAASPWVAKEIATFRALHPDRPILAAIVEGEPGESFPPPLTDDGRAEPLAADFRPGHDGRRLGLLKLVAGLSGVGLDALVQRDAQRRVRRVTYVTAAALAAMLVMAVLTAWALNERREAERQRADSEGLVEFMLTDLRDNLREVGRIDVMSAVNSRALAHYSHQNTSDLSADAAVRRARLLNAIGEDDVTAGDVAAARRAVTAAAAIVDSRLRRDPTNHGLRLEKARGLYWRGRIHELSQEWPQALVWYLDFDKATAALVASAPHDPDFMNEAGWSATDLGNVYLAGFHEPQTAEAYYSSALSWFERTAQARPTDRDMPRIVANAYANLGDSYLAQGKLSKSLAARERQIDLLERMLRHNPKNSDLSYRLATAQRGIAATLISLGDKDRARGELGEALATSRRLTELDPKNSEWLFLRAAVDCHLLFGNVGLPQGETPDGMRADVRAVMGALERMQSPRLAPLSSCSKAVAENGLEKRGSAR